MFCTPSHSSRNMGMSLTEILDRNRISALIQRAFRTFFWIKGLRTNLIICFVAKALKIDRNPRV